MIEMTIFDLGIWTNKTSGGMKINIKILNKRNSREKLYVFPIKFSSCFYTNMQIIYSSILILTDSYCHILTSQKTGNKCEWSATWWKVYVVFAMGIRHVFHYFLSLFSIFQKFFASELLSTTWKEDTCW